MIKYIISIITFAFFAQSVSALNLDSLDNALKRKKDSEKAEIYLNRFNEYIDPEPAIALECSERALHYAQNINDDVLVSKALYMCSLPLTRLGNYDAAINRLEQSQKVYEKTGKKRHISVILQHISKNYRFKGDLSKALEYALKALEAAEEFGSEEKEAWAQRYLASVYYELNNYSKSYFYYEKLLAYSRRVKDSLNIAVALSSLGSINYQIKNLDEAVKFTSEALEIAQSIKDDAKIGYCLKDLGNVYLNMGDYPKAIDYYYASMETELKSPFPINQVINYRNLAVAYLLNGDLEDAEYNLHNAMSLARKIDDKEQIADLNRCYGLLNDSLGNLRQSVNLYLQSLDYYIKENVLYKEVEIYKEISEVYERRGYDKLALKYLKLHADGRDSLEAREREQAMGALKATQEAETRSALIKKDLEIEQERSKALYSMIVFLVSGSVLLLGGLAIVIFLKRKVRKREERIDALVHTKAKAYDDMAKDLRGLLFNLSAYIAMIDNQDLFKRINSILEKFSVKYSLVMHELKKDE